MAVAVPAAGAAAALLAIDIAETVLIQIVGQIVGSVVGSALAPELDAIRYASYALTPGTRLSPQEAAVAVVKGHLSQAEGEFEAEVAGISKSRFRLMTEAAGNPPPADFLLQMARRSIIPLEDDKGADSISAVQGIRESFLHNKWLGVLEQGQWQLPSLGAVIEARLRNFVTPDEFKKWHEKIGFQDDAAGLEFLAAGVPISPQEGYAAYHRGLIPFDSPDPNVPSLNQVFRESRMIDKYREVWVALQEYLPPPRTVTALLRAGTISEKVARDLFHKAGLSPEMADAYVANASHQKTQATKELAVSTVVDMFKAKELTREQATAFIVGRGYTAEDAGFLLDYAEFQLVKAQVDALVSRVRTFYVGHKINKQTAVDALGNVGMTPDVIAHLLAIWDQEAHASPVLLTAIQIANAAAKGWVPVADAYDELQGRGYDARDAYLVLLEHKADVTGLPAPPGVTLTP